MPPPAPAHHVLPCGLPVSYPRLRAQLACGKYLAALAHTGDDAASHAHARSGTYARGGDGSAGAAGAGFRRLYMGILTDGAADELDALRTADESLNARGLGVLP